MNPKPKLAPSILTADFTQLGDQVEAAIDAGASFIHIDVMDGVFTPNLTIGPLIVKALRPIADRTGVILDTHLMIEKPERLIPAFAEAGSDIMTVHVETCPELAQTLQLIKGLGVRPGITLNPATPLNAIEDVLPLVDVVLVMSVVPGFGGQSYIPSSTEKIKQLRSMLDAIGSSAELEVDGGIKPHNAREVVKAGASVLVTGSAIFNDQASIAENMQAFYDVF